MKGASQMRELKSALGQYTTFGQGRFPFSQPISQSALPCAKPNIIPSCLFWAVLATVLLPVINKVLVLLSNAAAVPKGLVLGGHDDKDAHITGYIACNWGGQLKSKLCPNSSAMAKQKGPSMNRSSAGWFRPEMGLRRREEGFELIGEGSKSSVPSVYAFEFLMNPSATPRLLIRTNTNRSITVTLDFTLCLQQLDWQDSFFRDTASRLPTWSNRTQLPRSDPKCHRRLQATQLALPLMLLQRIPPARLTQSAPL